MQILFQDKKNRDLCEKSKVATKTLGADSAKKLKLRLSALEAAKCVTDLVAGRPHPLTGNRAGQFALDLAGGWRLVFSPGNDPCPVDSSGGISWSEVTVVCIEHIEDYHD